MRETDLSGVRLGRLEVVVDAPTARAPAIMDEMAAETDLMVLLRELDPVIAHREVVVVEADGAIALPVLAMVHEQESTTLVLQRSDADAAGLPYDDVFTWITLRVHSSLDAVGLTAAFSSALAAVGISCNVLAGARHDHLLVPQDRAVDALVVLRSLGDPVSSGPDV